MTPIYRPARTRVVGALAAMALAAGILLGARAGLAQRMSADDRTPNVIVLLVVDQFRADYIDTYHQQWSRGLRRLVTDGAWFREAYYPYFNTVTCPGHVSVATGAVPASHGVILNNWWDRASGKLVTCTEDDRYRAVSYGRPLSGGGESAARLELPTLADELRAQRGPGGHALAFSLKPRSAIPLGGRKPDAVVWFDDRGAWASSTAFTPDPVRAVADFVQRHPVERDFGRTWDTGLSPDAYLFENPAVGIQRAKGAMSASFPHELTGGSHVPDQTFYERWQSSPFADEYLAKMALDVAAASGYGTRPGPNLLAIGFSSLDKVGHDYGPRSREIQDSLVRLDRTLGDLFDGLDRLVGPGRYTVALTADHGVAPVPERSVDQGFDAGRIPLNTLRAVAEESLAKALGPGTHLTTIVQNYLYFEPGAYLKLQADGAAMRAVLADLTKVPGVLRAYTRDELESDRFGGDTMGHQAALSYVSGRSGDIMLVWKPYWIESANTTTHGTGYQYDTHVPVLFMGSGIAKGEYLAPASPLDVAPTLAFLSGVTLSRPSGRVLTEALARPTSSPRSAPAGGNGGR
jgi:predicted AlkP superfamily pyrophosphatase or phosphodiesterase